MPRVTHFEMHVDDPDRAEKFYSDVFGWKFSQWGEGEDNYWLIDTGDEDAGINGGMMKRREPPSGATNNVIEVPAIDDYINRVQAAGAQVVVPKFPIPGAGWVAYFVDPENNLWGLHQHDRNAK